MRHPRHDEPGFAAALRFLNRRAIPDAHFAKTVAAIIAHARVVVRSA